MFRQIMTRETMVRRLALGSPYSKPSTAEDSLPYPARRQSSAGITRGQYSRAAHAMQRGHRNLHWLVGHSVNPCSTMAYVRAPESSARCKTGDSTVRSGSFVVAITEARIFPKTRAAGYGTFHPH